MTILNSSFQPSLQFNLRRAAKARINRMCQPHARRKDLEAPDYVKQEWRHNGNKNLMADILQRVNWDKDNELLTWLNCILDAKINVFEHCLRIECSLVDTGRMPSATKSSSSWKRRRPSNSPSMKDGIPKKILKSLDGISAILKTNFNVSIQHSHIWIPSSKSQIGINRIKEEDRWGKATVFGFGWYSCQARIDSSNPKVWVIN